MAGHIGVSTWCYCIENHCIDARACGQCMQSVIVLYHCMLRNCVGMSVLGVTVWRATIMVSVHDITVWRATLVSEHGVTVLRSGHEATVCRITILVSLYGITVC